MSVSHPPGREALRAAHTPEAIRARLAGGPDHSYLRDFVYGAMDGAVTTFAVVSGVAGARLGPGVVLVLGVANLIADGFSMAAGNFLGTRTERQRADRARLDEEAHIEAVPDGEREEIRQIFAAKGLEGQILEGVVEVITRDRQRWVDTMLREELGLPLAHPSAWRAAWTTFAAFVAVGAVPLSPYICQLLGASLGYDAYLWSTGMTACAFFGVGAAKARFVAQRWFIGGLETLAIGTFAAGLAFLAGRLLRQWAIP